MSAFRAQREHRQDKTTGYDSNMSFWGTEVKPDKVVPFVPPPQDARLHISQACLTEGAGELARRVTLHVDHCE